MNAFPAVEFDVTTASVAGALIYWQRKEEQSLEVREDTEFRWLLLDGVVQSVLRHTAPDELCLPHQQILRALLPAHAEQVLHLGLGGGDFLRWLHHRYPELPILEVGPGMGVLTQFLVKKDRLVKVVEVDYESVAYLREAYPSLEDHIIEDDFLKMNLHRLFDGKPFVLTGNYPYNISSQIFFKMLDNKDIVPCCTGMIQKEVAERIAAGPGSKTYGILSVLIQAWYKVEYLFTVSEHVFNPPPKVKSAVIRMTRNETKELGCDEKLFKQVVKTTFNQRRKTLRNSIKPILGKDCPLTEDILFNKRPEQLSVAEFIDLTNKVEEALKTAGNAQ
jgi:16S rRNA (adenine1518-N6/adenine1519-N6)-dimethyltransferase